MVQCRVVGPYTRKSLPPCVPSIIAFIVYFIPVIYPLRASDNKIDDAKTATAAACLRVDVRVTEQKVVRHGANVILPVPLGAPAAARM